MGGTGTRRNVLHACDAEGKGGRSSGAAFRPLAALQHDNHDWMVRVFAHRPSSARNARMISIKG